MFDRWIKLFIKPGKIYVFGIDFTDYLYYGDKNGSYIIGRMRISSMNYLFSDTAYYTNNGKKG